MSNPNFWCQGAHNRSGSHMQPKAATYVVVVKETNSDRYLCSVHAALMVKYDLVTSIYPIEVKKGVSK